MRLTLNADFADMLRFPPAGPPGVIRLKVHPPTESAIGEEIQVALGRLLKFDLTDCLAVAHMGFRGFAASGKPGAVHHSQSPCFKGREEAKRLTPLFCKTTAFLRRPRSWI